MRSCAESFGPTVGYDYHALVRMLKRAAVGHVGTHGIRHRLATDIANSGISIKAGMVVTAHKTGPESLRANCAEARQWSKT